MRITFLALSFIISCFFGTKGWAQDAEFSQFYAAPSYLNPSMIGFSVAPRFTINYRHQQPTFGNAYLTLATSYDQHFDKYNSSLGISLFADRAGEGGLYNTYHINGLYAYQLQFNNKLLLKAGAQVGYFHQSLNWNALVFNDMIDPITGEITGASGEEIPATNTISKLDIGLGTVAYTKHFYLGIAFKHLSSPSLSFTNSNDPYNKLNVRSVFHIGHVVYLGAKKHDKPQFYLSPNFMVINQGRFWQINGGSYLGKGPIYGGLWYRHTLSNPSALIALLGVRSGVVRVSYSYDYNLAPVNTLSSAHEISIVIDFGQSPYVAKQQRSKQAGQCPEIFRQ